MNEYEDDNISIEVKELQQNQKNIEDSHTDDTTELIIDGWTASYTIN